MPRFDLLRVVNGGQRKEVPDNNSDLRARLLDGTVDLTEIISRSPKTPYMEDPSSKHLASIPRNDPLAWLANVPFFFLSESLLLFPVFCLNLLAYILLKNGNYSKHTLYPGPQPSHLLNKTTSQLRLGISSSFLPRFPLGVYHQIKMRTHMMVLIISGYLVLPVCILIITEYFKLLSLSIPFHFVLIFSLDVWNFFVSGILAICFMGMIRRRDTSTDHAAESGSVCYRDDHAEPIYKQAKIDKMDINGSEATSSNPLRRRGSRRTKGDTPQLL